MASSASQWRSSLVQRGAQPTLDWITASMSRCSAAPDAVEQLWHDLLRLPLMLTSTSVLPTDAMHAHKMQLTRCLLEVRGVAEIGYSRQHIADACAGPVLPGGVRPLENEPTDEDNDYTAEDEVPSTAATTSSSTTATATVKPLPRGTLRLVLTDGDQVILAMEKERVPALDSCLSPGSKLLIQAAEIRRGVVFLTPNNTQLLYSGPIATDMDSIASLAEAPALISREVLANRLEAELDRLRQG